MIRVNLLQNRALGVSESFEASSDPEKLALKNLAILCSLVVLLFLYEYQNVSSLKSQLGSVQSEEANILALVQKKKVFADEAQKLQTELQQLKDRVKIIRELSRSRFRELKTLDMLQNLIPEKVWFESLNYRNQKFEVEAVAVDIEDVTLFKTALDNQQGFKNITIKNTREKEVKNNTVHAFSMSFEVEDVN
ncbi:MAG: PilN domain-containing protein [Bdellovibrionales bacterium]|nr:PilN domain-containing protein [Bdellovibrionales bacterium]